MKFLVGDIVFLLGGVFCFLSIIRLYGSLNVRKIEITLSVLQEVIVRFVSNLILDFSSDIDPSLIFLLFTLSIEISSKSSGNNIDLIVENAFD
jgi:hypothetical protein